MRAAHRRLGAGELSEHEADEAQRDEAEGLRVAYVAATRARDLLVVPAVGDEPLRQRLGELPERRALPAGRRWRRAKRRRGCPPFGGESVLDRPAEIAFHTEGVQPGPALVRRTTTSRGGIRRRCHLGAQPRFGIRQKELLGKDASDALIDGQPAPLHRLAGSACRNARRRRAPKPPVQTATARAAVPVDADPR